MDATMSPSPTSGPIRRPSSPTPIAASLYPASAHPAYSQTTAQELSLTQPLLQPLSEASAQAPRLALSSSRHDLSEPTQSSQLNSPPILPMPSLSSSLSSSSQVTQAQVHHENDTPAPLTPPSQSSHGVTPNQWQKIESVTPLEASISLSSHDNDTDTSVECSKEKGNDTRDLTPPASQQSSQVKASSSGQQSTTDEKVTRMSEPSNANTDEKGHNGTPSKEAGSIASTVTKWNSPYGSATKFSIRGGGSCGNNSSSSSASGTRSSPRPMVRKRQRITASRIVARPVDSLAQTNAPAGPTSPTMPTRSMTDTRMLSAMPLLERMSTFSSDYHCPICRALMREAFISRCGHSFCYLCINQHLSEKQDCPICRSALTRDQIFPNFLLNSFLEHSSMLLDALEEIDPRTRLRNDLLAHKDYTREEIDDLLMTLKAKKRKLETHDQQVELEVLLDFLRNTRTEKEEALAQLNAQIQCLDNDMRMAQEKLDALKQSQGSHTTQELKEEETVDEEEDPLDSTNSANGVQVPNEVSEEEDEAVPPQAGSKRSHSQMARDEKGEVVTVNNSPPELNVASVKVAKQVNANKKRVAEHFEDLQRCYFDISLNVSTKRESALSTFCSTISKFTRFSRFELVNTLRYGDIFNTSSIVSSIEFDRDDEYFATAGVTKKIKIFEYGCIEKTGYAGTSLRDDDWTDVGSPSSSSSVAASGSFDSSLIGRPSRYSPNKKPITSVLHYPVREMLCRSKISCLSWNSYIKSQIASSDYEGIVSLWDSQTGLNIHNYDEHEKRAWSVDFSRTDPTRLASGSDDSKVKIWSTTLKNSVCTIESKANICCVKFNPESSHHLAFGSADHHIHYYDLRKATEPLFVFKGHRKAVSYVKFLGREELVSASTDSTLKLWNTLRMSCVRTYTGHVNEKNFVGLSASGDWISCGSENNAVYTYYKELRDPVVTVKFGNSNPVTGEDTTDEDPLQFVSSVCWKKNTSNNILLAANSSGVIKVLELV